MTLEKAIEKVRRLSRTSISGASNLLVMERINDAMKEFARAAFGLSKEGYITISPTFDIDTTFAVYRKDGPQGHYGPAIRANRPYTARHLPWYWDPANLDKEQKQYLEKCSSGGRTWTPQILEIAK